MVNWNKTLFCSRLLFLPLWSDRCLHNEREKMRRRWSPSFFFRNLLKSGSCCMFGFPWNVQLDAQLGWMNFQTAGMPGSSSSACTQGTWCVHSCGTFTRNLCHLEVHRLSIERFMGHLNDLRPKLVLVSPWAIKRILIYDFSFFSLSFARSNTSTLRRVCAKFLILKQQRRVAARLLIKAVSSLKYAKHRYWCFLIVFMATHSSIGVKRERKLLTQGLPRKKAGKSNSKIAEIVDAA